VCSVFSVGQPWTETPIHFIDFEGNAVSGILEFGVVTLRDGGIAATRTRRCRPRGRIAAADVRVHGLREELLREEAPFADEWDYFAGLRATGPFAAHFAPVENALLKSVWPYGRSAPDYSRPGETTAEWGPWIDTGRLSPQLLPAVGEAGLEHVVGTLRLQAELDREAARHCPADRRHFHAALYDALAGALLLRALLARPEWAGATLPWLLQQSTLDAGRRGAMQQGDLFSAGG
jgi:DNA polymerase III epsilon subunit-like protein